MADNNPCTEDHKAIAPNILNTQSGQATPEQQVSVFDADAQSQAPSSNKIVHHQAPKVTDTTETEPTDEIDISAYASGEYEVFSLNEHFLAGATKLATNQGYSEWSAVLR